MIQDGFNLDREKGAHRQYIHPQKGRVAVSFHQPSDTFPPKTLKSIIRDAEWIEEDLKKVRTAKVIIGAIA